MGPRSGETNALFLLSKVFITQNTWVYYIDV
jgi:hypothetical protein